MRWVFGLLKVLLAVCLVGLAVNLIFAYTSGINPFQSISERVKWAKNDEPKINYTENINSNTTEEPGSDENINPQGDSEKNPPSEDIQNIGSSNEEDEYFMTFSEVNSIENINLRDKLTGMSILSKIKNIDLQKIYTLADGGITMEELRELKKILEKSLNKSEIEKLDELLMKNKKLFAEGKLEK